MVELGLLAQQLNDSVKFANAKLDRRLLEAMNNLDVEGAMACFIETPELVVVFRDRVLQNPAALRQFLTDLFSNMRAVHGEIDEVEHWILGETVFAAGTATYEFEAADGFRSKMRERWTDARQKVAGRWVYVLCHSTQLPSPKAEDDLFGGPPGAGMIGDVEVNHSSTVTGKDGRHKENASSAGYGATVSGTQGLP